MRSQPSPGRKRILVYLEPRERFWLGRPLEFSEPPEADECFENNA